MKGLTEYQAIIADLDGTLYFQTPVRLAMLREMLLHFWRVREFLIVKHYRELYARGLDEGERLARLPADAPEIVREWMIRRPLPHVARCRDAALLERLQVAQAAGVPVIVYSDYPVKEKLEALDFAPDLACCAADLGCMKPDPSGIARVLAEQGIAPERCLVIGDREEKDGALADRLGADKLILQGAKTEREGFYSSLSV